jgi:hypothetical protein
VSDQLHRLSQAKAELPNSLAAAFNELIPGIAGTNDASALRIVNALEAFVERKIEAGWTTRV